MYSQQRETLENVLKPFGMNLANVWGAKVGQTWTRGKKYAIAQSMIRRTM